VIESRIYIFTRRQRMSRIVSAVVALVGLAAVAHAHFVYVVPSEDGKSVQVVFSDDLGPDKSVPISKVAGTKLTLRAGGKDTPLKPEQVENYLKASTPGDGARVVYGHTDYGVVQKGSGKPFRLHYHPKAILGDAFAKGATLGKEAVIEVVPVRDGAKVKFLVACEGKPLPGAEVFLRRPGAEKAETVKTDETGHTATCEEAGRYAVVARKLISKDGEHGGKKYEEERHYATLVVDVTTGK
jgi:uncharacterized GH25 family protein